MALGFRNPGWVAFAILVLLVMAVGCTAKKESPFGDRNRGMTFEAKGEGPPSGKDCAKERNKLCADLKPGGGGRNACLAKKVGQLSPKCKLFITVWSAKQRYREHRRSEQQLWVQSCDSDFKKHCGGKTSRMCATKNLKKLSKKCRAHVQAEANPCLLDRIRLCGSVDKSSAPCMKKNQSKLSKRCVSFRKQRQVAMKTIRKACSASLPDDCKSGGKMMRCLRRNLNQFPGECQVAFIGQELGSG